VCSHKISKINKWQPEKIGSLKKALVYRKMAKFSGCLIMRGINLAYNSRFLQPLV
jgi:hypothetical protein